MLWRIPADGLSYDYLQLATCAVRYLSNFFNTLPHVMTKLILFWAETVPSCVGDSDWSVFRQTHTHAHPSPGWTAPTGAGCTGHDDTGGRPLGHPRRVDWIATDGAKGRGDVGRRFQVFVIELSLRVGA